MDGLLRAEASVTSNGRFLSLKGRRKAVGGCFFWEAGFKQRVILWKGVLFVEKMAKSKRLEGFHFFLKCKHQKR